MANDWPITDSNLAKRALVGLSPGAPAAAGWQGAFPGLSGQASEVQHSASADPAAPTCFLEFEIGTGPSPQGSFDDSADPVRQFDIVLLVWVQSNAGNAVDAAILSAAMTALEAQNASEAEHHVEVQNARPTPPVEEDGWRVTRIDVGAWGGATE